MELGYMLHFAEKKSTKRLFGCYQTARIENMLIKKGSLIELLKREIKDVYEEKQEIVEKMVSDEDKLNFRF